jgi:uncharacterized protein (TIGR02270 family)
LTSIPAVLEQHAEEAAFLWLLRDAAVAQPHYTLADLAKLDGRIEAHLDGLRIAGEEGWDLCAKVLEGGEAGEVFAAAVLALESGREQRIQAVVKVGTAIPENARGVVSALGWLSFSQGTGAIKELLAAAAAPLRRLGIGAAAVHRQNPGQPLLDALEAKEPSLRARALRAAGELGLVRLQATLRPSLSSADPSCRFWANWSSALLGGDSNAVANLQAIAEAGGPFQERALHLALRRLDLRAAKTWQTRLAENSKWLRLSVIGAGVIGDPELVPWLIAQMHVKPLAPVAGEAFSMVTGVDLAYQDLDEPPPEDTGAGPTEDPKDENVAMSPDEFLPWPEPEAVARWWKDHHGEFPAGTRYLVGKPLSDQALRQTLRSGYQRQRAAAALELAIRHPGQPLFEVRAPGFRQLEWLASS